MLPRRSFLSGALARAAISLLILSGASETKAQATLNPHRSLARSRRRRAAKTRQHHPEAK
ncbi:hypothetical protein [Methylocapsa palsarum]|uniref:Uncharacterized protein n=1 Tax=Methylocapsa palsarum TaxID=1612308 RepID=A0A1I3WPA8_9HYPH|nr:hypothetical protein [Methylocapsa palsarum]SFK09023.1 hypothetical protein SAMN05444581_10216 [Methylocapsa palsarum]